MHMPHNHPNQGRPSLYASHDAKDGDADDVQRVRILSTLESSRRSNLPPSKRTRKGQAMGWLPKALIGLMAAGGLSLLAAFVLVVRQGQEPSPNAQALAKPPLAGTPPSAIATTSTPAGLPAAHSDPLQALAATQGNRNGPAAIESIEPKAAASEPIPTQQLALAPTAPRPGQQTQTSATVPEVKHKKAKTEAVKQNTGPEGEPNATMVNNAQTRGKATPASGKAKHLVSDNNKNDDDVALLEAMFAHGAPRKAPVSAAEDIRKQCGGLSGTEASSCKNRVCLQHPKSGLCRN